MTHLILVAAGFSVGAAAATFAAMMLGMRLVRRSRELAEFNRRFEAAFSRTTVGCAVLDLNGRWLRVNDALCNMIGYGRDVLLTESVSGELAREDLSAGDFELAAKFSSAVDDVSYEKRYFLEDGSIRWANVAASLIRDANGRPEFIASFLFDITARKEVEAALQASEERLRRLQSDFAYQTRTSDLGEMAAGIAHEINQPLSAIVNFLNVGLLVTEEGHSKESFAEAEEMMNLALAQALRGGEVVRRIREVIGTGEGTRTIERVEQLVDSAMAMALTDARSNGIEVRRFRGAGEAEVQVGAAQVQQILVNLLRNSVEELKELAPGRERWLKLSTQIHSDGMIEIEIADGGGGISPEVGERMFDPFITTKGGMGMGLPVCRRLAEANDGRIQMEGLPGTGAAFKFTLPQFHSVLEQGTNDEVVP